MATEKRQPTVNKRQHFRLEYPAMERPTLTIGKDAFEVLDLSERGVRFAGGNRFRATSIGIQLTGTISFRDGKSCEVEGKVLRVVADYGHVVLQLSKGVPLPKMLEEQRYLLKKSKGT